MSPRRSWEHGMEVVLYGIAGVCTPGQRVFVLIHCEASVLKTDWKKTLGLC